VKHEEGEDDVIVADQPLVSADYDDDAMARLPVAVAKPEVKEEKKVKAKNKPKVVPERKVWTRSRK
jgi:hypothetical protein